MFFLNIWGENKLMKVTPAYKIVFIWLGSLTVSQHEVLKFTEFWSKITMFPILNHWYTKWKVFQKYIHKKNIYIPPLHQNLLLLFFVGVGAESNYAHKNVLINWSLPYNFIAPPWIEHFFFHCKLVFFSFI